MLSSLNATNFTSLKSNFNKSDNINFGLKLKSLPYDTVLFKASDNTCPTEQQLARINQTVEKATALLDDVPERAEELKTQVTALYTKAVKSPNNNGKEFTDTIDGIDVTVDPEREKMTYEKDDKKCAAFFEGGKEPILREFQIGVENTNDSDKLRNYVKSNYGNQSWVVRIPSSLVKLGAHAMVDELFLYEQDGEFSGYEKAAIFPIELVIVSKVYGASEKLERIKLLPDQAKGEIIWEYKSGYYGSEFSDDNWRNTNSQDCLRMNIDKKPIMYITCSGDAFVCDKNGSWVKRKLY